MHPPRCFACWGRAAAFWRFGQEYLRFIALGAIFQVMGTGLVPFLRNMGGAVAAMAAMMAGFVTNIVLDYTFVWVLPYGMAGAAVATVLGQAVTLAVCAVFLVLKRHKPRLRPDGESAAMVKKGAGCGPQPVRPHLFAQPHAGACEQKARHWWAGMPPSPAMPPSAISSR